jgi:hypothetical protein
MKHTHTYILTHTYTNTYTHINTHIHSNTYIHKHIHTHIHTHTHTTQLDDLTNPNSALLTVQSSLRCNALLEPGG